MESRPASRPEARPAPESRFPAGEERGAEPLRIMGVLNVTPDSFFDAGRHLDPVAAVARGLEMESEGADILDIGGESARPGSEPVSEEVERGRVLPVLEGLAGRVRAAISIDTTKSAVARDALDRGATIVNDVSAGRADPRMLALVAERGATCVLMHMRGTPRTMQESPEYQDVVQEVLAFLRERAEAALASGVARDRIWIDPGIGFGKRLEHNLALLERLGELGVLGYPVCLGSPGSRSSRPSTGPSAARLRMPRRGSAGPRRPSPWGSVPEPASCASTTSRSWRRPPASRGRWPDRPREPPDDLLAAFPAAESAPARGRWERPDRNASSGPTASAGAPAKAGSRPRPSRRSAARPARSSVPRVRGRAGVLARSSATTDAAPDPSSRRPSLRASPPAGSRCGASASSRLPASRS